MDTASTCCSYIRNLFLCFGDAFLTLLVGQAAHLTVDLLVMGCAIEANTAAV